MPNPIVDNLVLAIDAYFESNAQRIANDLLQESIESWRYDDVEISREVIEDAADSAQYRMTLATDSAAWQGFQLGRLDAFTEGRPDQLIAWELDPGAEHCDTCLEYEAGSPYPANALPGIPGQAPTLCNGSCRCSLVPVGT